MATIPRHMMFFWGGSKMSWLRYMTLYSFRKLNPDWEMVLYICPPNSITTKTWSSPEEQDYFSYTGPDHLLDVHDLNIKIRNYDVPEAFRNQISTSQKSNFFKWDVLSSLGGWYSDMDILWIQPFETVYQTTKTADTILAWNNQWFSIGLLGSTSGNSFFRGVYENGFHTVNQDTYQSAGVLNMYNYLNRCRSLDPQIQKHVDSSNYFEIVKRYFPHLNMYNLPMDVVYPWIYTQMDRVFEKLYPLPATTIGIHWYAGCQLAQKYNQNLTNENCRTLSTTIGKALTDVLDISTI